MTRDYSATDFKRKFEEYQNGGLPSAMTALARSTVAYVGGEIDETGFLAIQSQATSLEKDFSQFLVALYLYLVTKGVPGDACDFVAMITALSGGDAENMKPLTDELIAEVMNISTRTVRRKRKALKEWMRVNRQAIIRIEEGEYDHTKKRNAATKYQVVCAPVASRIVLAARNGHFWKQNDTRAQKHALKEAAVDAVWEEPDAEPPTKERKKRKKKSPTKEIQSRRKQIFTHFEKIIQIDFKQGSDPTVFYEEFKFDLDETFKRSLKNLSDTGGLFGM